MTFCGEARSAVATRRSAVAALLQAAQRGCNAPQRGCNAALLQRHCNTSQRCCNGDGSRSEPTARVFRAFESRRQDDAFQLEVLNHEHLILCARDDAPSTERAPPARPPAFRARERAPTLKTHALTNTKHKDTHVKSARMHACTHRTAHAFRHARRHKSKRTGARTRKVHTRTGARAHAPAWVTVWVLCGQPHLRVDGYPGAQGPVDGHKETR
jgi:hypothetical protein